MKNRLLSKLLFDIDLYQIIAYYLGYLVIMRGRKCEVGLKIARVQTQLYIMIAPYKKFIIKRSIIGAVVFIKVEIIVKVPFEFFQLPVEIFFYGFCSIGFLRLYFVNSIIVNEFGKNYWFLMFEKADFLINILKATF